MNSFKRAVYKVGLDEPYVGCDSVVEANGASGIYEIDINIGEDLGLTGINYNAISVPDRFQIIYNNEIVADSKFVGYLNNINFGDYTLPVYEYDNGEFINVGTENITVSASDLSYGDATSATGTLLFEREDNDSNVMTIRVTGLSGGTRWDIESICPYTEINNESHRIKLKYKQYLGNSTCEEIRTSITGDTYYRNTYSFEIGTELYMDYQLVTKAPDGFYLHINDLYYVNDNGVVENIYPCE